MTVHPTGGSPGIVFWSIRWLVAGTARGRDNDLVAGHTRDCTSLAAGLVLGVTGGRHHFHGAPSDHCGWFIPAERDAAGHYCPCRLGSLHCFGDTIIGPATHPQATALNIIENIE